MNVSEPEPPHKREQRAKKVVAPVTSANADASPEKQIQVNSVQDEGKATKQKGHRSRKHTVVAPQIATEGRVAFVADEIAGQTSSVPPPSNVDVSPSAVPVTSQQGTLSTLTSMDTQSVDTEKGASAASAVVNGKEKDNVSFRMRILQRVLKGGGWLVNLCSAAIVSILLGFSSPITSSPILDFIQRYKLSTLVILSIVVLLMLAVLLAWPFLQKRLQPIDARLKAMGAVTGVSMLSSTLCLSLLLITLTRPAWCPTSLCVPPQVVTKPITTTQGTHDSNLDIYFVSFESSTYVIPGDPQKPAYIPSSGDPRSISAIGLDAPKTTPSYPYTIAIGLHSLYTGRYSIFIDKVTLLLIKVSAAPDHLNVYPVRVNTTYSATNPARFVYQGQQAQQVIVDTYSPSPHPRVELRPGESDQIDAAIEARTAVDIQFVLKITYHIATEQQHFTLTLNHTFEAVFSKTFSWQKYQLNLAQNTFVK